MKQLLLLFTVLLTLNISAQSGNEKTSHDPYLEGLDKNSKECCHHKDGLEALRTYVNKAQEADNPYYISRAYQRMVYYYAVTMQQIGRAETIVQYMKERELNEENIFRAQTYIVFACQYKGQTIKAVELCRKILRTSHKKDEIAEASFNIILMYYDCGMLNEVTDKIIDLCHFSENITSGKESYHYDLTTYYAYAALFLLEQSKPQSAYPYLLKCDSVMRSDEQSAPSRKAFENNFLYFVWGEYHLACDNNVKLQSIISKLKGFRTDQDDRLAYELEYKYYLKHRDFAKAGISLKRMEQAYQNIGMKYEDIKHKLAEAEIAEGLGGYQEAARLYHICYNKKDSIFNEAIGLKTNEYEVQLGMAKAKISEKETKANAEHFKSQMFILLFIITIMIAVGAVGFVIYLRKSNRKLGQVNRKLHTAYDRMEKLSQMKISFIQSMSHEIRTPLNSIVGFSQVLGVSNNDESTKQITDTIIENGFALTHILDDVLDISAYESEVVKLSPTNVNECCENAIAKERDSIGKGVTLTYESSDRHLEINSNSNRLTKLIGNLLDNARKFTKSGSIVLQYEIDKNQILHISVTDTGCGIPADKVEWVFERFTKIDTFTPGTGLGLAVCQLIVTQFDGSISIDKSYKDGCKVDVFIPVQ